MQLREPEKQIINDYEHSVTNRIAKYLDREDFPKFEQYGIDRQELDSYLFDQQAILDMEGSERTQLTVAGIITVLPLFVLAACPDEYYIWGKLLTSVAALVLGFLLYLLLVKLPMRLLMRYRLRKMRDERMERFIEAVLSFA